MMINDQAIFSSINELLAEFRDGNNHILLNDGSHLTEIDELDGVKISFEKNGNIIVFPSMGTFVNCTITLKQNDVVFVSETKNIIRCLKISSFDHDTFTYIGKDFSSSQSNLNLKESGKIFIGDDCMFSNGIDILCSDMHAVLDANTFEVINLSKDIIIGNHVWLGQGCKILKGVHINDNCVVGAGAVLTKKYLDNNVIIAGNPASIVKRNVTWNRKSPNSYKTNKHNRIVSIIPARYESSRFPGKPLADICGKPMIQWVYERVSSVAEIKDVYVATDDDRIFNAVSDFGGKAVMTGDCSCGTDRVYQASRDMDADIIINVQGDEPLIEPDMIHDLIDAFNDENVVMATLKKRIENPAEIDNPNVVKVITDNNFDAVYFSRFPIPYNRDKKTIQYYKHIGIYGYRKNFLERFVSLSKGKLETAENLEQLRALENGYKIRVIETEFQSIGVDVPEDLDRVINQINKSNI